MASPSPATVSVPPRKVCLIGYIRPEYSDTVYPNLYVFDLDPNLNPSPDLVSLAPVIRFETRNQAACCVVNSTLYLFDGHARTYNPNTKSARSYDIDLHSPVSVSVEPNVVPFASMKPCPPMHGLKHSPAAVPTPDNRKIVVFSRLICPTDMEGEGSIHFELYDVVNRSWEQLPPFPDGRLTVDERKSIVMAAYSFIDDSTFLIYTQDGKPFTLNHHPNGAWTWDECGGRFNTLENFRRSDLWRWFSVLRGGQLCVSCGGLYDLIQCSNYCNLPENLDVEEELASEVFKRVRGSRLFVSSRTMARIDPQTFCVLVSNHIGNRWDGLPIPTADIDVVSHPHVYIDVYEMSNDGTPTKTKSYKFRINTPCSRFYLSTLFPI